MARRGNAGVVADLVTPSTARRGAHATSRLLAWALGVLSFFAYLANLRPMGAADTVPTRLLPFSILREANVDLDEFHWLRSVTPEPYFLKRDASGHWRSTYPITTALLTTPLAAPFVWWSRAWQMTDADSRFRLVVIVFDRVAAALVTALSVGVVFLAARQIAPVPAATAATLVYAFGTNTWSTSSQTLWQHALAELALAGAAYSILKRESPRTAILAGFLTALSIAARPQTAIVGAVFALFFVIERRRAVALFLGAAAPLLIALVVYNLSTLDRVSGGYTGRGFRLVDLERLAGLLISPSRGLLVYCPLALLAVGAFRPGKPDEPHALRYLGGAIVAYALFYASFNRWWAGHSYGPRFFTDVMPLVTLCALPVAQRLWAGALPRKLLIVGIQWCIFVQIVGVFCDDDRWNRWPVSVDQRPERLWDWSDPQIVRALRSGWHGGELAPLLRQLVVERTPAPLVLLEWDDLQATITPVGSVPMRFHAGVGGPLTLRIRNDTGDTVWPAFSDIGDRQVGIAVVWKAGGVMVQQVGDFQTLRTHLAPGAEAIWNGWIEAPKQAGRYDIEINLVQNLGNSGRFGGAMLVIPAIVE